MSTLHVTIRRNVDGEVRRLRQQVQEPWDGDYMWSEGNYSCDCNRAIFWHEADGHPDPCEIVRPCGDGAYTVLSITQDDDPKVLYAETPP